MLMPTYNSQNNPSRNPSRRRNAGLLKSDLSSTTPFDDNPKWKLFITTSSKVCAWDHQGCDPIFTSSSRGIVAAKRARDGSTLAIADAQVVMLHKVEDGQDKSYRLRGTQRCRLLQYSHDSRNLFYTDSLHNSVQSYSLSDNRVADAARSHPSPICAFAVSCDSNLILSASAKPSTIQIYNQMMTTTVSLVPAASAAPVVTCAFHPNRKHIFLLAFGDGVLAAFDYTKFSSNKNPNKENAALGITRCHARGIHTFRHLHDPSVAGSAGITGAGFVPGQRSRAVTVGEDGRCFLVDFDRGDTIGSWHIGAPATSLAIREIDAGPGSKKDELGGYFIAVGTVHGRCSVYDGNGNKVAEQVIDAQGESVLDVEWVCGDLSLPDADFLFSKNSGSNSASPRKSTAPEQLEKPNTMQKPIGKSGNVVTSLSTQDVEPTIPLHEQEGEDAVVSEPAKMPMRRMHRTFSPPVYDPLEDTADQGYMKLFSPVKRKRASKPASLPEQRVENPHKPTDPRIRASAPASDHRSAISAPQMWQDKAIGQGDSHEDQDKAGNTNLDSFDIFEADPLRETTTIDESHSSKLDSNGRSVFEGLSNVPGDQIKVDEITDDGRILSEIRSIRAKFSGRATTTPQNVAQVESGLSDKAKSTPVSRIEHFITPDPELNRSASAPEWTHADQYRPSDHVAGGKLSNLPSSGTVRSGLADISVQAHGEKPPLKPPEDGLDEDDGDIWVAQAVTARSRRRFGRKRKKSPADQDEEEDVNPDVSHAGRNLSRLSSTTHSSKSRKTVSWCDNIDQPHLSVGAFPTTFSSSSMLGDRDDMSESSPAKLKPSSTSSQLHKGDAAVVIPSVENATEFGEEVTYSTSIREIVTAALAEMQTAMTGQMNFMQSEMQRLFREQHDELQGLRSEITSVRQENEKLRNMLFQSTGVRDSVKRNIGTGGSTH